MITIGTLIICMVIGIFAGIFLGLLIGGILITFERDVRSIKTGVPDKPGTSSPPQKIRPYVTPQRPIDPFGRMPGTPYYNYLTKGDDRP